MKTAKERALLEAIAGIQKIVFKDKDDNVCYLLYNEANIGEAEAEACLDREDFKNPNIAIMTKKQFDKIFLIKEQPKKKEKEPSELQMYRQFKKAKKAGLLDGLEDKLNEQ